MRIVRMDYGEYCRHFAAYARRPGTYDAQRYEVDVSLPPDLEYTPRRFVAVRLPYRVYKCDFAGRHYRHGDYDPQTKTIICYVPVDSPHAKKYKNINEIVLFKHGITDNVHIAPEKLDADSIVVEVPECLLN